MCNVWYILASYFSFLLTLWCLLLNHLVVVLHYWPVILLVDFPDSWHTKWNNLAWVLQITWSQGQFCQTPVSAYDFLYLKSYCLIILCLCFATVFPGFSNFGWFWSDYLASLGDLYCWTNFLFCINNGMFLSGTTSCVKSFLPHHSLDLLFFLILDLICWTSF